MIEFITFWLLINVSCGRFVDIRVYHLILKESPPGCSLSDFEEFLRDFGSDDYLFMPQFNSTQQPHNSLLPDFNQTKLQIEKQQIVKRQISLFKKVQLQRFGSCFLNFRLTLEHVTSLKRWHYNFSTSASVLQSSLPMINNQKLDNKSFINRSEFVAYDLPIQRFDVSNAELILQNISIWLEVWDQRSSKILFTLKSSFQPSIIEILPKNFSFEQFGNSLKLELSLEPCMSGFVGPNCDIKCSNYRNHYECHQLINVKCQEGWSGINCSTPICTKPCFNRGLCIAPNTCECSIDWSGSDCSQCVPRPGCQHGYCQNPGDCICHPGWTMLNCDKKIDICAKEQPCRNGGICRTNKTFGADFLCICVSGFGGLNCTEKIYSFLLKNLSSAYDLSHSSSPSSVNLKPLSVVTADNFSNRYKSSLSHTEVMITVCVVLLALILFFIFRISAAANNVFVLSLWNIDNKKRSSCAYFCRERSKFMFDSTKNIFSVYSVPKQQDRCELTDSMFVAPPPPYSKVVLNVTDETESLEKNA